MLAGVALRSVEVAGGEVALPQYRVLAVLADIGDVRSARVAEALGLEASTITRLVDRLAAGGYVTRGIDPTNRSAVMLSLTDAGRRLVSRVVGWRRAELERILQRLAPDDRASLASGLAQLVDVAGDSYGAMALRRLPV